MKNCIKCNAEINDNERFCHICGTEQAVNQPEAGADSFAGSGTNQPPHQPNVYFTPGTDVQPTAFNGNVAFENVGTRKKKTGSKFILGIIITVIFCVVGGIVGFYVGGDLFNSAGSLSVSQGVFDENSYTNSSVDLRIDCPDGWEVLSGDYLSDFLEITPDAEGKYVDYDGTVYEFAAMNLESYSNVLVSNFKGNIADAVLDEDEAVEAFIEGCKEDGNTVGEPYKMTIGGETYNCFDVEGKNLGTVFNQRICFIKEGMQYFQVVITVFPEDDDITVQEIVDNYFTSAK